MSMTEHLGGVRRFPKLQWPDKDLFNLWRWCAAHTRRPEGGAGCVGIKAWRQMAVWGNRRRAGESHGDFTLRAMLESARRQIAERRKLNLSVPVNIMEMLADEIAQDENQRLVGK